MQNTETVNCMERTGTYGQKTWFPVPVCLLSILGDLGLFTWPPGVSVSSSTKSCTSHRVVVKHTKAYWVLVMSLGNESLFFSQESFLSCPVLFSPLPSYPSSSFSYFSSSFTWPYLIVLEKGLSTPERSTHGLGWGLWVIWYQWT